jgi:hypothetical protein
MITDRKNTKGPRGTRKIPISGGRDGYLEIDGNVEVDEKALEKILNPGMDVDFIDRQGGGRIKVIQTHTVSSKDEAKRDAERQAAAGSYTRTRDDYLEDRAYQKNIQASMEREAARQAKEAEAKKSGSRAKKVDTVIQAPHTNAGAVPPQNTNAGTVPNKRGSFWDWADASEAKVIKRFIGDPARAAKRKVAGAHKDAIGLRPDENALSFKGARRAVGKGAGMLGMGLGALTEAPLLMALAAKYSSVRENSIRNEQRSYYDEHGYPDDYFSKGRARKRRGQSGILPSASKEAGPSEVSQDGRDSVVGILKKNTSVLEEILDQMKKASEYQKDAAEEGSLKAKKPGEGFGKLSTKGVGDAVKKETGGLGGILKALLAGEGIAVMIEGLGGAAAIGAALLPVLAVVLAGGVGGIIGTIINRLIKKHQDEEEARRPPGHSAPGPTVNDPKAGGLPKGTRGEVKSDKIYQTKEGAGTRGGKSAGQREDLRSGNYLDFTAHDEGKLTSTEFTKQAGAVAIGRYQNTSTGSAQKVLRQYANMGGNMPKEAEQWAAKMDKEPMAQNWPKEKQKEFAKFMQEAGKEHAMEAAQAAVANKYFANPAFALAAKAGVDVDKYPPLKGIIFDAAIQGTGASKDGVLDNSLKDANAKGKIGKVSAKAWAINFIEARQKHTASIGRNKIKNGDPSTGNTLIRDAGDKGRIGKEKPMILSFSDDEMMGKASAKTATAPIAKPAAAPAKFAFTKGREAEYNKDLLAVQSLRMGSDEFEKKWATPKTRAATVGAAPGAAADKVSVKAKVASLTSVTAQMKDKAEQAKREVQAPPPAPPQNASVTGIISSPTPQSGGVITTGDRASFTSDLFRRYSM